MHLSTRIGLAPLLAWFFTLSPVAAAIEGRILGPEGEPRPGTLRLLDQPDDPDSVARVFRAGRNGRFEIDAPATAAAWLRIESPGLEPALLEELPAGEGLVVRLGAGATVNGSVIDLNSGEGLPEATVWVCDRGAWRFGFDACARFEVGEHGEFSVTGVPKTGARIGASSPVHAFEATDLPDGPPAGLFQMFELRPGAPFRGRVVDDRGRPVAGAKIGRDEYTVPFANRTEVVLDPPLITDATGRFRHPGTELRTRWVYRALIDGWYGVPSDRVSAIQGTERELQLTLQRPATLQFGLAPQDGALVQPQIRLVHRGVDVVDARAGEDGRYRLTALPTKPLELQLKIGGYQTLDLGTVELGPGKLVDQGDLTVVRGVRLSGDIVDGNGNGVASAWIALSYDEPVETEHRSETADGRFHFDGLPTAREVRLTAGADGYEAVEETFTLARDSEREIVLTPLASIRGRVLDPAGEPVARYVVEAMHQEVPQNLPAASDVDDPDGRFILWPIETPGLHTVEIRADGYRAVHRKDVIVAERSRVDIGEIHLEPGHRVEGLATRPDGRPAVGGRVWLAPRSNRPIGRFAREFDARTGVEGRFAISGLSPGFFIANAQHPEFAPWSGEVEIPPDIESVALDIEFTDGGIVHGYTRNRSGTPVGDVGVGVECPAQHANRSAKTDAQGYYRVTQLPDAQCRVHAFVDNGAPFGMPKSVTVVTDRESRIDFDLSRAIEVSGVVRVGGRVADRGFLTFQASGSFPGTGVAATQIDPGSGSYRVELSDPGEYRVQIESGNAGHTATIRIENQPSVSHDFDIPLNWIRGRVVDGDGNPLEAVIINAANPDPGSRSARLTMTRRHGRFELKHLPPGTYRIAASRTGSRPTKTGPIQVRADTRIDDLELVLEESAAQIRGRVIGPRGAPVSEGWVVAAPTGTLNLELAAQGGVLDDGSFVLDVPAEGSFDVTALARGWAPARMNGVLPSYDAEITLQVGFGGGIAVTVVDRNGAPAEGRALEIRAEPPWLASEVLFRFTPPPVSGPDGVAVAQNLSPGSYRVSVPGGASAVLNVVEGGISEVRLSVE